MWTMSPSELRQVWEAVARPPIGRLNGRRVPETVAWAAVDPMGLWHLLILVAPSEAKLTNPPTRGLRVTTEVMQIADEVPATHIDLACVEPAFADTFVAFALDVLKALEGSEVPRTAVLSVLERWRRFWSVDQGLSEDAALGLFGELWFLERWMSLPAGVRRWLGPERARHDFQWDDASVEVKTSRSGGDGAPVHRIASLDQLADPERGRLWLFSLHVTRDVLAANTLPALVSRVELALAAHPAEHAAFMDHLASCNYSPAHADRYDRRWRILSEQLYSVEGGFPRLLVGRFAGGLPAGVRDVSYTLDMAACANWCIADRPSAPAAAFLRS
jgi:hypothetical protein